MSDPYKVLGISRDADETEIKKAYRALSKKYHPDNNPGNAAAEEVFKQVQAAYEQIMRERKQGYSDYDSSSEGFGGSGFGGFGGFSGGFGGESSRSGASYDKTEQDLQSAAVYINNRYYDQALNVLNSMEDRPHQWYYYSAVANMGLGNNITALEHAKQALSMQPDNYEYQRLVSGIENGNISYNNRSFDFGINSGTGGNWCVRVILCNLALNLCFGGSGLCCGSGMGGGFGGGMPGM